MSDMKMSDVWGWDSIPQSYGHYEAFTYNGTDRKGDFYGFLFCTEEAAEGVAHAVRNHDRMVEEIAELRGALKDLSEKFEHTISCQGKNPEMWGAYRKSKQLLKND